jgi:nicotinamide-nucleotide amidase
MSVAAEGKTAIQAGRSSGRVGTRFVGAVTEKLLHAGQHNDAQMSDPDVDALARALGERLAQRGMMCATAESCTGGLVAGAITSIAGSSGWFERGFVTYTNEAKVELLGVPEMTLAAHGAVSEATARAMAQGALARSRAKLAVAITGIAGPGGGTADKPVGLVCFAWAFEGQTTTSSVRHFPGDRAAVRRDSVVVALQGMLERLEHG